MPPLFYHLRPISAAPDMDKSHCYPGVYTLSFMACLGRNPSDDDPIRQRERLGPASRRSKYARILAAIDDVGRDGLIPSPWSRPHTNRHRMSLPDHRVFPADQGGQPCGSDTAVHETAPRAAVSGELGMP